MVNKQIIKYNKIVKSCAMSKSPNQSGLSLTKDAFGKVRIESINPRLNTETSYLYMEIPNENIDDVIKALIELKNVK